MTRRERVIDALNHKETDTVPYNIDLTHKEREKVASYLKRFQGLWIMDYGIIPAHWTMKIIT